MLMRPSVNAGQFPAAAQRVQLFLKHNSTQIVQPSSVVVAYCTLNVCLRVCRLLLKTAEGAGLLYRVPFAFCIRD